jgi:hypothetical protein
MAITLKEAFALNDTPTLTKFSELQAQCKNTSYFTSSNPINYLSSWEGFYYGSSSYEISSLTASVSTIPASGGSFTITYTINNINSNGSKTPASGVTPTISTTKGSSSSITSTNSNGVGTAVVTIPTLGSQESSSTTINIHVYFTGCSKSIQIIQNENIIISETAVSNSYGDWSYNWIESGNSTRTRTYTIRSTYSSGGYSDRIGYQTETGGQRYLVLQNWSDGLSESGDHKILASGGTITADVVSHDYWPDINGTVIQTPYINNVNVSCNGFSCSSSGYKVYISANNLGTNIYNSVKSKLTASKDGFNPRSSSYITQEGNYVTSIVADINNRSLSYGSAPAGGGVLTPILGGYLNITFNYSSGSSGVSLPDSTYGSLYTSSRVFNGIASDTFGTPNINTGEINVTSRGTNEGEIITSAAITMTETVTWIPSDSYNIEGVKTTQCSIVGYAKQDANNVIDNTTLLISSFSYPVADGGGGDISPEFIAIYKGSIDYSSGSSLKMPVTNIGIGTEGASFVFTESSPISNDASVRSNGVVRWSTNYLEKTKEVGVTVSITYLGKTATATTISSQNTLYTAWEFERFNCSTIIPIPITEVAYFTCDWRRGTPSGYEYTTTDCQPASFYNNGSYDDGYKIYVQSVSPSGVIGTDYANYIDVDSE